MSPRLLPPWRPMKDFDPSKPAVIHNGLNDKEIEWSGGDGCRDDWLKSATQHIPGVIEWDGYLIDRWREPVKH